MKFFKNLFRRSKGDDDEDLEDDEEFGFDDDGDHDDDDRLRTQAIMDDEDDLDTDSPSDDEGELDTDSPSGVEEHFGMSEELSNDDHDDKGSVAMGGNDYEAEPDDGQQPGQQEHGRPARPAPGSRRLAVCRRDDAAEVVDPEQRSQEERRDQCASERAPLHIWAA